MSEVIEGTRRSITFSKSMMEAMLAGRKTQTRRLAIRIPGKTRYRNHEDQPKESVWNIAKPGDVLRCGPTPRRPPVAHAIITATRKESLHEITEADAFAEGIMQVGAFYSASPTSRHLFAATPLEAFRILWESLHGPGTWARNPRVVVLTFRMLGGAT